MIQGSCTTNEVRKRWLNLPVPLLGGEDPRAGVDAVVLARGRAAPQDPTVGLCLGPYGGPRGECCFL
jgi:hypothetical protein